MSSDIPICIRKHCNELYEKLLNIIEACSSKGEDSPHCIECCFNAAEIMRLNLEKFILNYQFADVEEEIWFFKKMKPQFVALVEFFILIYRSIMFCPDDNKGILLYWQQELKSLESFFKEHASFYLYIKNGAREKDHEYFVRSTSRDFNFKGIVESEPGTFSNRDYLVAACLARERYLNYVQSKLSEIGEAP